MTIQGAIGNYLRGRPELAGLGVWPVRVPDGTTAPYVYYRCHERAEDKSLTGPDLRLFVDLSISCVSNDYDAAWTISRSVRQALDYYNETMYGSNSPVDYIEKVTVLYAESEDDDAPELGLFQVSMLFSVSYPA